MQKVRTVIRLTFFPMSIFGSLRQRKEVSSTTLIKFCSKKYNEERRYVNILNNNDR